MLSPKNSMENYWGKIARKFSFFVVILIPDRIIFEREGGWRESADGVGIKLFLNGCGGKENEEERKLWNLWMVWWNFWSVWTRAFVEFEGVWSGFELTLAVVKD
jgi:hypothetical protein